MRTGILVMDGAGWAIGETKGHYGVRAPCMSCGNNVEKFGAHIKNPRILTIRGFEQFYGCWNGRGISLAHSASGHLGFEMPLLASPP